MGPSQRCSINLPVGCKLDLLPLEPALAASRCHNSNQQGRACFQAAHNMAEKLWRAGPVGREIIGRTCRHRMRLACSQDGPSPAAAKDRGQSFQQSATCR